MIPLEMQAEVDTAYSTTDTIALKRQIEKENYRNLKAQNLKSLLSKKKQYEDEAIEAYLINTSSSEIYTFTVKITLDDSLQTSKTEIYKANPGQEILIGCNSYMTEDMQIQKQTFKVVGEKKGN